MLKKKLSAESIALENVIERKELVIQKAGKGNAVVITDRTKHLEVVKSLLSDSSKFTQLPIDEVKWINYIINKSMEWFLYDNGLPHERVKG